jgi:activator of 2-hydroxyglutaryl-CoA dehydratase/predicted nucleotide-binding protein (sugar kinase/HSP70/actin superfamily)
MPVATGKGRAGASSQDEKNKGHRGHKSQQLCLIDAGVEHIHISICGSQDLKNQKSNEQYEDIIIKNNDCAEKLLRENQLLNRLRDKRMQVLLTGKMGRIIQKTISNGIYILPSAALWQSAIPYYDDHDENYNETQDSSQINIKDGSSKPAGRAVAQKTLGLIELSASGYTALCIDEKGRLVSDLLSVNPKCGAGCGINLARILEKLDIAKENVDIILKDYLGESGKAKRSSVTIRADRCGVFSSSATISDKNQGIPLDYALAVTLKSEILKACKKMLPKTDAVVLTGRVFAWQFARDCAEDHLREMGVKRVIFHERQMASIIGMKSLALELGYENIKPEDEHKLVKEEKLPEYPSFSELNKRYTKSRAYKRMSTDEVVKVSPEKLEELPVNIGIDAGSTMAKIAVCNSETGEILMLGSYDNHGDTVETVKHIFQSLRDKGVRKMNLQSIGLTGSGRFQVQKVLSKVYPEMESEIFALVENYAHAYGSISYAKEHIMQLKKEFKGKEINEDFYSLVDIGGEDTKVSVISMKKEELFDNAMNVKCSAGTGSLMDTLKSLFGIEKIGDAYRLALSAKKAYEINATCAVFLMENAKKMQSEGYPKDEILASCSFAIVENMARTLWNRIDFPRNSVVMLHGQTMQSDPLPLAVVHRLLESSNVFCLVPPHPGHRACIGLAMSAMNRQKQMHKKAQKRQILLDTFLNTKPTRKIFFCRGAACGDPKSCCARTLLTLEGNIQSDNIQCDVGSGSAENSPGSGGKAEDKSGRTGKVSVMLGGCTAVNSVLENLDNSAPLKTDYYREIWGFIESKNPKSKSKDRLVIPRSFAVSEQAYFLSRIFKRMGITVHVDNVAEQDILAGQPNFSVDVCAPLIGAAGQYIRLAREPHGIILVPQIDYLPAYGMSLGKTCTTNQGGVLIAMHYAKMRHPDARFCPFDLTMKRMDAKEIASQIYPQLAPVFAHYKVRPSLAKFTEYVEQAILDNKQLRKEIAGKAAEFISEAVKEKRNIAVVCGREYILNPGIYDSHAGKLLRDKGIVAIPSYVLDVNLSPTYSHIYWKNPHDLMSKIEAITGKSLHSILVDDKLKKIVAEIEKSSSVSINIVQVSTFRCGPDSMTLPISEVVARKKPNLLIQSDAMIKELAHLENRVNTFITQIEKKLHEEYKSDEFKVELLESFNFGELDQKSDVIYFPTMHDNRVVTNVIRGAGITCIDNYEPKSYDLRKKVRLGRRYAGDTICAPFAAVFADILLAVEDFRQRKRRKDPLVRGKKRILVFDNKGSGPCRQGQYYELHKLLLHKKYASSKISAPVQGACASSCGDGDFCGGDAVLGESHDPLKLMVAHEKEGFNIGLDEWVLVQAYQGLILQGLLHSVLLKSAVVCRDYDEYREFMHDYYAMQNEIYHIMEHSVRPNKFMKLIVKSASIGPKYAGAISKYFCYGLYNNNGYRKVLKKFSSKWFRGRYSGKKPKMRIHADGEVYIRVSQVEDLFRELVDLLGFGNFELDYTPLWSYFELAAQTQINDRLNEIKYMERRTQICKSKEEMGELRTLIKDKQKEIFLFKVLRKVLRKLIVSPLYSSAGIEAPHDVSTVLEKARKLSFSLKPRGELTPYIGEAISKSEEGIDLFLNVAPESCMVSSMGQAFSEPIQHLTKKQTRIQDLFTLNGEINREKLEIAVLKTLGPMKFYRS